MSRIGVVIFVALFLIGCTTVPLPPATYPPDPNAPPTAVPVSATETTQSAQVAAVVATAPLTLIPPSNGNVLAPTTAPTKQSPTVTQTVSKPTPTQTKPAPTVAATVPLSPTNTVIETPVISPTLAVTATGDLATTPTVRPTAKLRATEAPKGPATLTPLFLGQRVTAFTVGPDGSLYYGVAPNDESLQTPSAQVFQLWKKPANGDPLAITPPTLRLVGGVLVHEGMIYFNEQGALRRMPDNNATQEGEVVIRYPMYLGNQNLPYGHMNHSLALYNLNGKPVMLLAMGSLLDSTFPGQGLAADIAPPYYENFPTGRILYATLDWLNNTHGIDATQGVAGEFDEFARGLRNPWAITVGTLNGQTRVLAVDDDPAFTPEKNDDNPRNSGDELNELRLFGNYGHPYAYAGQEPAVGGIPPGVVFDDGSVPSGVAIAANKVFVGLHNASMVAKVDLQKHTYTPVLEGISPFNLFAIGNTLYVSDFNGIYMIDAGGL